MHTKRDRPPPTGRVHIEHAHTDEQIMSTFPVMRQLRAHLAEGDYIRRVRSLSHTQGFRLAYLTAGGAVRAVAGYRYMDMLDCGRLLYVDDLVTDEGERSHGYGAVLLTWLKDEARNQGCAELQLISRVTRQRAHRFYFREGLRIECFHFRIAL